MSATIRPVASSVAEPPVADIAARRVAASNLAADRFFRENVESIALACRSMARRFQDGGRLLVYGGAAQASDVAHVVVEFLHPVVVGKRALPAIAVTSPAMIESLGRGNDILMILEDAPPGDVGSSARARGMLVLRLSGPRAADAAPTADFHFAVPSGDACIVQETHEMLYHVLWELSHVFFDHRMVGG